MNRTITATYRIVTPMFCAGADQSKAELRLPSFKGALRFWWRSLHGHLATEELREQEAKLFGSSELGQSQVRLRLSRQILDEPKQVGAIFEDGRLQGAHYLGYGVMMAGKLTRPMIPGGRFTAQVQFHPSLTDVQIEGVSRALILLGTVGGIGSKARKGFGSLTLNRLEGSTAESLPDGIADRLRHCLRDRTIDEEPDWTAWSTASRVVAISSEENIRPVESLDRLGQELVHYRSWGRNGKVLRQDSEQNFRDDHDLSKGQGTSIRHPRRAAFGLPHNYGKGDRNEVKPASRDHDRRASPLFFHIHQTDAGVHPTGVVSFLPSRFLPNGEQIRAFGQDVPLQTDDLWEPIHGYLDRLIGNPGATDKKTDLTARELSIV